MSKNETTRTREHGTRVTRTTHGAEVIAAVRDIIATRQYAKINGYMVDGFTAAGIIEVYDKLDRPHQEVMAHLPIHRMADVAFQLINCSNQPATA
jgi:hypothetical protein